MILNVDSYLQRGGLGKVARNEKNPHWVDAVEKVGFSVALRSVTVPMRRDLSRLLLLKRLDRPRLPRSHD
jgi:hypothetical protein